MLGTCSRNGRRSVSACRIVSHENTPESDTVETGTNRYAELWPWMSRLSPSAMACRGGGSATTSSAALFMAAVAAAAAAVQLGANEFLIVLGFSRSVHTGV